PGEPAVLARDHLVQIDRLVERPKLLRRFGPDAGHAQRGTELQLGYADARRAQRLHAARRILEFDRGVTHVVADAEVAAQRVLGGARRQPGELAQLAGGCSAEQVPLEEADRLVDRLEETMGLGLEGKGDGPAGPLANANQVRRVEDRR